MGENGMYRILACDDERDIVSALRIYLTAEGYEVLEAYNGREMLRLAATQEVHLILLDVMMPGMDGLSAMAARSCVHPICMRQESRNTTTMSNRCWRDLSMSRRAIRIT